jgi:broad specificity phosphatase PhoE
MGTLYLVRHGQASFGADDYDQLSALGRRQSVRLGEYLRGKGHAFRRRADRHAAPPRADLGRHPPKAPGWI